MVVNAPTNSPLAFSSRFWRCSKYMVPLDRHAWGIGGAVPPRELATYRQLADSYPELVQFHDLGCDHDWGEFPFPTIQAGQLQPRTAHAEAPFRQYVVSLKQASCVGRHCCVLGPNNTLVAELGYYLSEQDPCNRKRFKRFNPAFYRARWLLDLRYRRSIPAPQKLPGTALLLNNPWCHNFYHWMLEVAPRIMMARQAGLQPDWYVVDCQSGYQRRTLQLLGVPSDRIIQPHYALHLQADEFWRPSHPGLQAWKDQAAALLAAVEAGSAKSPAATEGQPWPRRIYISRRAAAHRKVANELELERYLESQGFQVCVFEQLDMDQQVRLVHHAEAIVAVHGAALANLIYARPGTRIVEICPASRYNADCFPRLSHKFGHSHIIVMAPCTRFRQRLSVNLSDVAQALQWCGLGQAEGRGSLCARVA